MTSIFCWRQQKFFFEIASKIIFVFLIEKRNLCSNNFFQKKYTLLYCVHNEVLDAQKLSFLRFFGWLF